LTPETNTASETQEVWENAEFYCVCVCVYVCLCVHKINLISVENRIGSAETSSYLSSLKDERH